MKDTLKKAEQKMTKSTERLKGEFSSIRALSLIHISEPTRH